MQIGDKVKVINKPEGSPLAIGAEGIVESIDPENAKITLSLYPLENTVTAEVSIKDIEKI